jgi:predicted RNase H-like HicB family nuclease
MKQYLNFKVIINQDEDGVFVASCPAIPGCHTQGDTYEEAERNIKEAIRLCLKVAEKDEEYRASIDFGCGRSSRFIGISDIVIPWPEFL